MERLTDRGYKDRAFMREPVSDDEQRMVDIIERLAAYEDTGLEPEEINRILDAYGRGMTLRTEASKRLEMIKDITTDRLRELVQMEEKLQEESQ